MKPHFYISKSPCELCVYCIHRFGVDAAVHGLHPVGEDVAVRRDTVRPLAVARLHRMPVLHLHRLLHHRRPLLLDTHAGQIPRLAHQAQDAYSWHSTGPTRTTILADLSADMRAFPQEDPREDVR